MSMRSYTTKHDLKDIFLGIYHDCPEWEVKFWNFTEYKYMYLTFGGVEFDKENNRCPVFIARYKKSEYPTQLLTTGLQWQKILRVFDDDINGVAFDEYSRIVVKYDNFIGRPMKIHFVGSSQQPPQINYCIDWEDPCYHAWKRILRMKWMTLKYKLSKLCKFKKS